MANQRKHTPKDSGQTNPGHDEAVTDKQSTPRGGREAKTADPAKKREKSEQPPTRHNAKT